MSIAILDPHVANLIAAGEVVERPASIVKELVDNSIDAGARTVVVAIVDGGKGLIRVQDDGIGMTKNDLELAIMRHATSKICTQEDLERIGTLGFRGEALASIASVSRLVMATKQKDDVSGWKMHWDRGVLRESLPIGMQNGTWVEVSDLFVGVPARLKFLKQTSTEQKYIVEELLRQSVSHPEVSITLESGSRTIFTYQIDSRENRVRELFTQEIFSQMIPVTYDHLHWNLSGWVGLPQLGHERGVLQYLVVNGRCVYDRLVMKAVKDALGGLLMPRMQVPWVFYLDVPADMVDINVHPRKEEVRFVNPSAVYKAVHQGVEAALSSYDLRHMRVDTRMPSVDNFATKDLAVSLNLSASNERQSVLSFEGSYRQGKNLNSFTPAVRDFPLRKSIISSPNLLANTSFLNNEIVQINALYLVTEDVNGIRILDQHAVHERILYERFLKEWEAKTLIMQPLLVPIEISLNPTMDEFIDRFIEILSEVGFSLEREGRILQVTGIPSVLSERNLSFLINEMLGDMLEDTNQTNVDSQTHSLLTYMACRSAVKSGDALDERVRQQLLMDLETCTLPYTCPHGRPVEIVLSWKELEERFKRRV